MKTNKQFSSSFSFLILSNHPVLIFLSEAYIENEKKKKSQIDNETQTRGR